MKPKPDKAAHKASGHTKAAPPRLTLPASVFSPQDLAALMLEIKLYARWAAHAAVKQQLKQSFVSQAPVLSPGARELLQPSASQSGHQIAQKCEQLLHDLNELKAHAPIVTITLAAPPVKDTKTALVGWCRQNIDPGALVAFQFNGSLLGGMVVRFGSHVHDWSFRRQILENRTKFAEVLRRV